MQAGPPQARPRKVPHEGSTFQSGRFRTSSSTFQYAHGLEVRGRGKDIKHELYRQGTPRTLHFPAVCVARVQSNDTRIKLRTTGISENVRRAASNAKTRPPRSRQDTGCESQCARGAQCRCLRQEHHPRAENHTEHEVPHEFCTFTQMNCESFRRQRKGHQRRAAKHTVTKLETS